MGFVEQDGGVGIHFVESGSRDDRALVLVPGQGSPAATSWARQLGPFVSAGYRVIAVDNRGAGETVWPGEPFSIGDLAADVAAVLDHLKLERVALLGLSLGSIVALEFSLTYGDRLDALVLACSQPGGSGDCVTSPTPETLTTFAAAMQATDVETQLRLGAPIAFSPRAVSEQPDLVREYFEDRFKFPAEPAGIQAQAGAVMQTAYCDRLAEIRTPTLVLHGSDDQIVPPANADALAAGIPNAEQQMLPGGHILHRESADAFNAAVTEFLGRHAD